MIKMGKFHWMNFLICLIIFEKNRIKRLVTLFKFKTDTNLYFLK